MLLWTIWRGPFFYVLTSVGEIAIWVFLDWKGRALSKRGVVYGTLVFRTESVDGKQRKGFYVVSYSDEPCLEMVIFLYIPSVLVWKRFVMDGGRGGGEITRNTTEKVVTVHSSGSRLVWQIEERTSASTVCNKIYNFHFSAYFKFFARSESKDHLFTLQVRVF